MKSKKKKKEKKVFITPFMFIRGIIAAFYVPKFFYDLHEGKYNDFISAFDIKNKEDK